LAESSSFLDLQIASISAGSSRLPRNTTVRMGTKIGHVPVVMPRDDNYIQCRKAEKPMASNIKHRVEPLLGWLFVAAIAAAVGLVLLAATRPAVDQTARMTVQDRR
jgi:hypothetical protein